MEKAYIVQYDFYEIDGGFEQEGCTETREEVYWSNKESALKRYLDIKHSWNYSNAKLYVVEAYELDLDEVLKSI